MFYTPSPNTYVRAKFEGHMRFKFPHHPSTNHLRMLSECCVLLLCCEKLLSRLFIRLCRLCFVCEQYLHYQSLPATLTFQNVKFLQFNI